MQTRDVTQASPAATAVKPKIVTERGSEPGPAATPAPERNTLKKQILAKYDELAAKTPEDVVARGFTKNSPSDKEFVAWYATFRENAVRTGERKGERMEAHARWHIGVLLRERAKAAGLPLLQGGGNQKAATAA